ncbi:hypothetical protein [Algoriphagus formosus]|uniref:hypothetical protein n=1 Tax=Algoriphagus formosus TaxID=2007308 RepID=UPI0014055833|nr:hypothetical protein [Algoriphagus aquimaris]
MPILQAKANAEDAMPEASLKISILGFFSYEKWLFHIDNLVHRGVKKLFARKMGLPLKMIPFDYPGVFQQSLFHPDYPERKPKNIPHQIKGNVHSQSQ